MERREKIESCTHFLSRGVCSMGIAGTFGNGNGNGKEKIGNGNEKTSLEGLEKWPRFG